MIVIELLNSFDNRDIALLIWLAILFLWIISSRRFRKPLKSLCKAICAKPIILSILALICYIFLIIYLLNKIGIWDCSQLKATIFWTATIGLKSLYDINEIKSQENFFHRKIIELFTFTLLLDFYINLFKMPLIIEILFLPFMVYLFALQAYSETKSEFKYVYSIISKFIVVIGFLLLIYVSWMVVSNFAVIFNLKTIQNFVTPILLSLFLLPFTYTMIIYVSYEDVFFRLDFIVEDKSLHNYTKWQLIKNFKLRRDLLQKWFREALLNKFNSKEDIKKSIITKTKTQ